MTIYKKLQYNFDVIQYLVTNATSKQWTWRDNATGWPLGEVIRHLRNVEMWHADVRLSDSNCQDQLQLPIVDSEQELPKEVTFISGYGRAFGEYAYYRQKIMALLQNIAPHQWQCTVSHQLFGRITLAGLVEKIADYDQAHIKQIEGIIHAMPLNPLLARAIHEVSDYHRRYQPHLARAVSLLDIGIGPGLALRHVIQQNLHLTCAGVDVRDMRLPDVDVPLQIYDGHTLPFTENQFDISLLLYVLHHCQDPLRLLDEAVRVTRQKIILIEEFDLPGADEISLDLTERQSHRALGIPPDLPYQLFDRVGFESMLHGRNLIELEQQTLPSETTRPVQKYLYVMAVSDKPRPKDLGLPDA